MDPEVDQEIIDGICEYVEKHDIKGLLQEYLKRLVIEKPENPLEFLVKTIGENPYKPPVIAASNESSTKRSSS